jgi:hypothetical protein
MAIHHHPIMEHFDRVAAGAREQEGQQPMHHAGNTRQNHAAAEERRGTHVLDICLADGSWVIGEEGHGRGLQGSLVVDQTLPRFGRNGFAIYPNFRPIIGNIFLILLELW